MRIFKLLQNSLNTNMFWVFSQDLLVLIREVIPGTRSVVLDHNRVWNSDVKNPLKVFVLMP